MKLGSLLISKTEIQFSVFQFPHSCICEGFIYSQHRPVYFAAAKKADQSWKYGGSSLAERRSDVDTRRQASADGEGRLNE